MTLQAALEVRHSPAAVSDTFVASRLEASGHGATFGTLGEVGTSRVGEILDRTFA